MPDFVLWVVPFAALALHLGLVRYNLRGVQDAWDDLMHRVLRRQVGDLEAQVGLTALMADDTLVAAEKAREKVDLAEARRLLDLAYGVITTALPDRMARVEAMSKCCRMLAAVAPLPPLLPRDFRLREMVALGTAATIVHQLLAGMQERFQWACMVIGWGYRLVLRGATRANNALQRDVNAAAQWARFTASVSDFKTLDAHHVRAFSALLQSLALSDEPEGVELVGSPR
jgi:hypothetical protein